ncbi:hypothetical protein ASF69_00060 [Rhizobium sp. Leaf311]|nr:hypothetical protein ASF69_00060 [Rhizobium sp. Leaf311]
MSKEAKVDFFDTSFANVQLVAKAPCASSAWRLKIRSNDVFLLVPAAANSGGWQSRRMTRGTDGF